MRKRLGLTALSLLFGVTALALFAAFMQQANIETINVANPIILAWVLLGAMLPFVFSAMAMILVVMTASL